MFGRCLHNDQKTGMKLTWTMLVDDCGKMWKLNIGHIKLNNPLTKIATELDAAFDYPVFRF